MLPHIRLLKILQKHTRSKQLVKERGVFREPSTSVDAVEGAGEHPYRTERRIH